MGRWMTTGVVLGGIVVGCGTRTGAPAKPIDAGPSELVTQSSADSTLRTEASASAQAPPRADVSTVLRCGTVTCDLTTERCCEGLAADQRGVGRCIPKDAFCHDDEISKRCDDAADCPTGSQCCAFWACSGGCPMEYGCQARCGDPRCVAGGTCAEGYACDAPATGRREALDAHVCRWVDVGASCGGERCRGATPRCCFDEHAGTGRCVARDTSCPAPTNTLDCTDPKRDCGSAYCWAAHFPGAPPSPDRFECAELSHVMGRALCRTKADCPAVFPPTGQPLAGCQAVKTMPGVKECVYDPL